MPSDFSYCFPTAAQYWCLRMNRWPFRNITENLSTMNISMPCLYSANLVGWNRMWWQCLIGIMIKWRLLQEILFFNRSFTFTRTLLLQSLPTTVKIDANSDTGAKYFKFFRKLIKINGINMASMYSRTSISGVWWSFTTFCIFCATNRM